MRGVVVIRREESVGKYPMLLSALLCLFIFRVLAQLLQVLHPVTSLPELQQWQGSSLPYPILLVSQLLIVFVVVIMIRRISVGALKPTRRVGYLLLTLGGVYFIAMLLRLVLGLTLLSSVFWFATPIPAFFHLVLASIVLVIGHYHYRMGQGVSLQ